MNTKRKVEIFSAGCPVCEETVSLVNRIACPSCELEVLDLHTPAAASSAKDLGISSVPALVIDGKVADCCEGRVVDEQALRSAGVGQPIT